MNKDTVNTGMSWSDFAVGSAKIATVVALQLGAAGFAHATPPVVGASVPGVPAGLYLHPNDSSMGITQAVAADPSGACGSGYVFSGGSCVRIPEPASVPSCSYGRVYTGGRCVSISTFVPPATSCASGQVLSGGACVAIPPPPPATPSCGAGTVLSGGACVPISGGGSTPPACPPGQAMAGGSCYTIPGNGGYSPPAPGCAPYSGAVTWGGSCGTTINTGSMPQGGTGTANSTSGTSGYITFQCSSNLTYQIIQQSCVR